MLAIKPTGQGDVTETHVAWKVTRNAPHTPSPLLDGNELYVVSDRGAVSCLDAKSGEVIWMERFAGQNFSASPLLIDGKIYLQSEDGVGTVLKAGRKFEQLARNPLNERTLASFAVVDGALFVRTETPTVSLRGPLKGIVVPQNLPANAKPVAPAQQEQAQQEVPAQEIPPWQQNLRETLKPLTEWMPAEVRDQGTPVKPGGWSSWCYCSRCCW